MRYQTNHLFQLTACSAATELGEPDGRVPALQGPPSAGAGGVGGLLWPLHPTPPGSQPAGAGECAPAMKQQVPVVWEGTQHLLAQVQGLEARCSDVASHGDHSM